MSTAPVLELPHPRSLNAIVAEIIETTDLVGPHDIAIEVSRRITDAEREEILATALVGAVRLALHAHRAATTNTPPPGKARQSPKVRAIRDGWQRTLAGQWHVAGEWLRLADFTVDTARTAAAERRAAAAEHTAQADRFDLLAKAIADAGVYRAGDLDTAPEGWTQ